jgi:hypothetical protein
MVFQVAYCDFLFMYPTVCTLMNLCPFRRPGGRSIHHSQKMFSVLPIILPGREIALTVLFVPSGLLEADLERKKVMPKKRFSAEQIVTLLRQIEVALGPEPTSLSNRPRRTDQMSSGVSAA